MQEGRENQTARRGGPQQEKPKTIPGSTGAAFPNGLGLAVSRVSQAGNLDGEGHVKLDVPAKGEPHHVIGQGRGNGTGGQGRDRLQEPYREQNPREKDVGDMVDIGGTIQDPGGGEKPPPEDPFGESGQPFRAVPGEKTKGREGKEV